MSGVATEGRSFYVAGGTLAVEADSYVERSADKALREALLAGRFCYVLNSRQMGKSSLCVRTMSRLDADGVSTAFVDLTRIGGRNVTPEQWYAGIAFEIGRSLNLRNEIRTHWAENSHLSPLQRLFGALREVGLAQIQGRIAIFFDEIDATRSLPFSPDEFFAGIRECYNRRVQDKEYGRLTFCLLGVAVPSDLINSPTSTPFNIGERVYLKDFTLEEAMSLADGLPASNAKALIERVFYWTNGHPYLTQSLCEALAQQVQATMEDVDALVRRDLFQPNARETNINLADVANRALHAGDLEAEPEKFRADLLSAYEKAWKDKSLADDESNRVAALLKLSGIMRSEGNRLYVRNRIYRQVFGREWIKENMPGQELRRQRRAFYVGVFRTAFIATAVTAAISWLAWNNARLAREANLARTRAEYERYVAIMNSMRSASDFGDSVRMRQLLDETKDSPSRSIEWNYWNAQLNDALANADFPKGLAWAYMSGDGKKVLIEERRDLKAVVFSIPKLNVVQTIVLPGRDYDAGFLGNRSVLIHGLNPARYEVRDAATNALLGAVKIPAGGIGNSSAVTKSGRYFAQIWAAKGEQGIRNVTVYRCDTFTPVYNLHFSELLSGYCGISEDAKTLLVAKLNRSAYFGPENAVVVCAIDTTTGKVKDSVGAPAASGFSASSDGSIEAINAGNGRVVVRDIIRHRTLFDRVVGPSTPGEMFLSNDGSRLMTMASDQEVKLWNVHAGALIAHPKGADDSSMTPDGRYLVLTGGGTRLYDTWKPRSTGLTRKFDYGGWSVNTSQSTRIVAATKHEFQFLNSTTLAVERMVPKHVFNDDISASGGFVLTGNGKVSQIVSVDTGKTICQIPILGRNGFDATADGRYFVLVDDTSAFVHLFDRTGKQVWQYRLSWGSYVCKFTPDGSTVAVALFSGDILLFDAKTGSLTRTIHELSSTARDIAFTKDSRYMAAGGADRRILIFDLKHPSSPVKCDGHTAQVWSVAFSPDGRRLLSSADDGIRLWDPSTGEELLRLDSPPGGANVAGFSSNQSAIYYESWYGLVRVIPTP